MSRMCKFCGKKSGSGNSVSHSHRKTKRKWHPNLQKVRAAAESGVAERVLACTECIKAGKVMKP